MRFVVSGLSGQVLKDRSRYTPTGVQGFRLCFALPTGNTFMLPFEISFPFSHIKCQHLHLRFPFTMPVHRWSVCGIFKRVSFISADRNITSIICRKKTYIDKKIDAAGVYRCYQDACGVMNRVSTIQASCLAIGCGIERSSTSPCCLLCRQDTPTISCDSGRMQVAIPKSLMSRQLFLNSSLRDPNCRGYETKRNFVFATKIYNCGTAILSQVGGQQSYSNSVQTTADEGKTKRPFVKVSCTFERKLLAQGLYKIKQTKVSGVLTGILFAFTSKGGRLLSSKKKFLASEKRIDVSISSYVAKRFRLKLLVNSCHLSVSKWIAWGNKKEHYLIKDG